MRVLPTAHSRARRLFISYLTSLFGTMLRAVWNRLLWNLLSDTDVATSFLVCRSS